MSQLLQPAPSDQSGSLTEHPPDHGVLTGRHLLVHPIEGSGVNDAANTLAVDRRGRCAVAGGNGQDTAKRADLGLV